MLFFRSTKKGIREFLGFGIIEQVSLVTQRDPKSGNTFSNYVYDCAVFNLKMENEHLYWEWIHKRCDKSCTIDETHELAPQSWKDWCKTGNLSPSFAFIDRFGFIPLSNCTLVSAPSGRVIYQKLGYPSILALSILLSLIRVYL